MNNFNCSQVLAAGECISAGSMALAMQSLGINSKSINAFQVPITSIMHNGEHIIHSIAVDEINKLLNQDCVPIITGFQAIDEQNNLVVIGRGGSDTTAVALSVALKSKNCYIYTDVNGIYPINPSLCYTSYKKEINTTEMLEVASAGAQVIAVRAARLAKKYDINLYIRSSFENIDGGTLVSEGFNLSNALEKCIVNTITVNKDIALCTISNITKAQWFESISKKVQASGVKVSLLSFQASISFIIDSKDEPQLTSVLNSIDLLDFRFNIVHEYATILMSGTGLTELDTINRIYEVMQDIGAVVYSEVYLETLAIILVDKVKYLEILLKLKEKFKVI